MTKKVLTALRGSIKKWREIATGRRRDRRTDDCPLCKMFYKNYESGNGTCGRCPVAAKTGHGFCLGSPYEQWMYAGYCDKKATTKEAKLIARKELKFLQLLVPKPKKKG